MSIEDPAMRLTFEDGELLATPDNTELFTYVAMNSLYSHILLNKQVKDGRITGIPIFEANEAYQWMSEYMIASGYPVHLNLRTTPDYVIESFDNMIAASTRFEDYVPGEWLDESN